MKTWPFLLVVLLAGCTRAPQPQAITRIVLSRTSCDPLSQCGFAQYVFYPDGRVKYTSGLRFDFYGRMPLQEYHVLVQQLVATQGAFGPRWDYGSNTFQQAETTIWTDYSGRHWQVRFPTTGLPASPDVTVNGLNSWARTAAQEAGAAIMRARREIIARRRRVSDLRRVVFVSNGCFGTCSSYTAQFFSDGTAKIRDAGVNLRARVAFANVTRMLTASAFAELDPEYPFRVEDVYGVSFEFDYRGGYSYAVLAPDRTQWPPDVAQLVGSFQQLVRDTDWTPGS